MRDKSPDCLNGVVKDGASLEEWYRRVDDSLMDIADSIVCWGECYRVGDFTYVSPSDFEKTVGEEFAELYVCVANLVDAGLADITFDRAAALVRDEGIGALDRLMEPISDSCRDAIYFTEMYPEDYCGEDLEVAAYRRPELFSVDYCNLYPALQYAAVSAGVVDLFELEHPLEGALRAWYEAKSQSLASLAVDTVAAWGGNMAVPSGWVTEEQWDAVLPTEQAAAVFRIYSALHDERRTPPLLANIDNYEWLSRLDSEILDSEVCECYYTEIWPRDFTREELDGLYSTRPDLFNERDVSSYDELGDYKPKFDREQLGAFEKVARSSIVGRRWECPSSERQSVSVDI